jgi:hypothetical protein
MKMSNSTELLESIEELVYQNCKKDTLNFDEFEEKYNIDLRKYIDIEGIKKCISLLNKTGESKCTLKM